MVLRNHLKELAPSRPPAGAHAPHGAEASFEDVSPCPLPSFLAPMEFIAHRRCFRVSPLAAIAGRRRRRPSRRRAPSRRAQSAVHLWKLHRTAITFLTPLPMVQDGDWGCR